ncbi:MAG: hypothetical protein QXO84_03280 [Candidatus Aenigmatarchaeota archaeon]
MILLFITLLLIKPVLAVCPLCTVGVAVGLGLSRYLGIDDIITGIWIGALLLSLSMWLIDWMKKKKIVFSKTEIILPIIYFIVILPLYFLGFIGHAENTFFGIDRLIFGILLGTLIFLSSVMADNYLRKINDNKVLFAYQKVIIPLFFLIISSIVVYLLLGIFS